MVLTKIDGAQKAPIIMRKKRYRTGNLRFARYLEYRTMTYNQSGFKIERHGNTILLHLSKIGFVEIRQHRQIPYNTDPKQVIITKSKSGKWFACVTCDIDAVLSKINIKNTVGIDVGIKNLAYDSNGHYVPNQLNLKKMLKPLARVQR